MMRNVCVGLCLLLAGCASTPAAPPAPVLSVAVDDAGPMGTACTGEVQHVRGRRPEGTVVSAVVTAMADRPVPLEALEQVVFVAARRRCGDGFAVVRADANDGATGFTQAIAEVWVVAPPAPDAAPSP